MVRFIRTKGLKYLVEALSMVVPEVPNLYCVILGDGELRGALERQIASLGLENRIYLLGEREHNEALAIVQDCDFFVMPSLSEGTPLAMLEAGALGRPIIVSGDRHLLELGPFQGIPILTPSGFLEALRMRLDK